MLVKGNVADRETGTYTVEGVNYVLRPVADSGLAGGRRRPQIVDHTATNGVAIAGLQSALVGCAVKRTVRSEYHSGLRHAAVGATMKAVQRA
jgi:hypothetical protein